MGWVVMLWAGARAVRDDRQTAGRTLAFLLLSTAICFAQLLVAHDTSRLLGLTWFPTLVLLRRVDFASRLHRASVQVAVAALLLLQLALPPLFVLEHRAIPLNCYAQSSLRRVVGTGTGGRVEAAGGLFQLSEDAGHRPFYLRRCDEWGFFRNQQRHRWW
jgi:hypothetical protein